MKLYDLLLQNWPFLYKPLITKINTGLINESYLVQDKDNKYILQKVNKIFGVKSNIDIYNFTEFLSKKNFLVPQIINTKIGELFSLEDNDCYRLLTYLEGDNFDFLNDINMLYSAGNLIGKFHDLLKDFSYDYLFTRPDAHNTKKHLELFLNAINDFKSHKNHRIVKEHYDKILLEYKKIPDLTFLPMRHCHGDLKINNILFKAHKANALLDLDTIGKLNVAIELGDALRSWCNIAGEDSAIAKFSIEYFEAAMRGYAGYARKFLLVEEIESLVSGLKLISLELSMRFLRDSLEEKYFNYNANKFESRSHHNLIRGLGQWNLYLQIKDQENKLNEIIKKLLNE
jgi:Ser/Thr protein kinase RdoA (MazF antagonist)